MACFLVPAAEAVVTAAASKAAEKRKPSGSVQENPQRIPFSRKLKWLSHMLLGLYFAEDYLRDMLTTTYFGEPVDAFLCTQDGHIIAFPHPQHGCRPGKGVFHSGGILSKAVNHTV